MVQVLVKVVVPLGWEGVRQVFSTILTATFCEMDRSSVREIAELAVEVMGLKPEQVHFEFTGGNRGWKGDVPHCPAEHGSHFEHRLDLPGSRPGKPCGPP
jgi:hypothetical protein